MTSTGAPSHVPITQAGLVALLVSLAGLAAGAIPSMAPYEQVIVSAIPTLVAIGWLLANAIHAHAPAPQPTVQIMPEVQAELLKPQVDAELQRILLAGLGGAPPAAPSPPG
jgi:hypothetical protein